MKYAGLEIGADYVLERRGGQLRVTALETDADDVRAGKVLVRFSGGIFDGREELQPLSMISRRWGAETRNTTAPERPTTVTVTGAWPPQVGDEVRWPDRTGALLWRVIALDESQPVARIQGQLFGREQEQTALLSELEPITVEKTLPRMPAPQTSRTASFDPGPSTIPAEGGSNPKELVEKLVDRMIFQPTVIDAYRAQLSPRVPRARALDRIRKELLKDGRPIRRHRGEYLTIRTKRFEIRLGTTDFRTKEFIDVDEIHIAPHVRAKPARSRPRQGRKPRPRRKPS